MAEDLDIGCYAEMIEMTDYCSSAQINWLADLWHHMELQNDPSLLGDNTELQAPPDKFDDPTSRVFTY
eukprot:CAMPEP_0168315040 /NCGR_PEP_ID=MMETSP0210-20121227/9972_1 /TAXON_ID=40633 /ORGANISM="Condylostoma magnum, Strain COL2" /LENGTH=67 /DNA_ID=CAMNT_0008286057 /DNA_START=466 /DNA_END=669 /DNA_ORIENTATION=+